MRVGPVQQATARATRVLPTLTRAASPPAAASDHHYAAHTSRKERNEHVDTEVVLGQPQQASPDSPTPPPHSAKSTTALSPPSHSSPSTRSATHAGQRLRPTGAAPPTRPAHANSASTIERDRKVKPHAPPQSSARRPSPHVTGKGNTCAPRRRDVSARARTAISTLCMDKQAWYATDGPAAPHRQRTRPTLTHCSAPLPLSHAAHHRRPALHRTALPRRCPLPPPLPPPHP